jgi:hypothetical protein
VAVDGHHGNRRAVGVHDRDRAASGIANNAAMGQVDVGPVLADDFSATPVQDNGFRRVVGNAESMGNWFTGSPYWAPRGLARHSSFTTVTRRRDNITSS